jgi:putative protease
MELMTSRQCFFLGVDGCFKEKMNEACLPECSNSATISNKSKGTLFIDKKEESYSRIYSEKHFLNTKIVKDLPGLFSGILIDLRDIKTSTRVSADPEALILLFNDLLRGEADAPDKLHQAILETSDAPYRIGI